MNDDNAGVSPKVQHTPEMAAIIDREAVLPAVKELVAFVEMVDDFLPSPESSSLLTKYKELIP